jgi:hypothetical protein
MLWRTFWPLNHLKRMSLRKAQKTTLTTKKTPLDLEKHIGSRCVAELLIQQSLTEFLGNLGVTLKTLYSRLTVR